MKKRYEVFECTEDVNIALMCSYAKERQVALYRKFGNILVLVFPYSDPDLVIKRYNYEMKIEEIIGPSEEFEFCDSKKHFKSFYLTSESRAFCLRIGRLLQFSMRNSDATLNALVVDLFSLLFEEKIISNEEFQEVCHCISSIWVLREEFSEIYFSGLYEQCVPHITKKRRKKK